MWVSLDSTFPHCVASERAAKNSTAAAKIHCATLKRLRRVSAKNLSVYLCVAAPGGFGREGRECVKAPCPAQPAAAAIASQQIVERIGQCSIVARLHEETCLLVLDHVAQAAGIECNHGRFAEKRFDCHETEPFIDRWNHDRGGALIEQWKLGLGELPMPAYTRGNAELLCELLE